MQSEVLWERFTEELELSLFNAPHGQLRYGAGKNVTSCICAQATVVYCCVCVWSTILLSPLWDVLCTQLVTNVFVFVQAAMLCSCLMYGNIFWEVFVQRRNSSFLYSWVIKVASTFNWLCQKREEEAIFYPPVKLCTDIQSTLKNETRRLQMTVKLTSVSWILQTFN